MSYIHPVKILVIRFSSIGDIVLTSPVLRVLKKEMEEVEIHFLIKPSFIETIQDNPYIDKIHLLQNMKETTQSLKNERFTYIIDLQNSLRSFRLKRSLKTLSFTVNKRNFDKFLITNLRISRKKISHIVERYMETLSPFSIKGDGAGLDFFIHPDNEVNLASLSPRLTEGYVGIVVGGSYLTKRIPVEIIVELVKKIPTPVVLLGGGDSDRAVAQKVVSECGEKVIDACSGYNLQQSASLVRQAEVIVTGDTGLMHIAAAFHKKIVSIWGATSPVFGMYPYTDRKRTVIIENSSLSCHPCSKFGKKQCPKKHFQCMKDLSVEDIQGQVIRLFSLPS